MTTIVTRAGKGSPLTHTEVDTNFTNLNTNKLEAGAIALGSAATPSISFTGDTNTGIYSPGADQLAISTNGTERLRLSSTGELMFKGAGTTPGTDKAVSFSGSAPINSMVLDSSGRLGVGTSSPNTALDVNGTINVRTNGYEFGRVTTNNVSATTGGLNFQYNSAGTFTNGMVLDGAGLVGIGTQSPDVKLHVAMGNGTGYIKLDGGTSSQATTGILFRSDTNNYQSEVSSYQGNLQFVTGANERARIDSAGRWLLGTSSSIESTSRLQVKDGSLNIYHASAAAGAGYAILFTTDGSSSALAQAKIEGLQEAANTSGGRLVFSTSASGSGSPTERMRIGNAGGIDVSATGNADNYLRNTAGQTTASGANLFIDSSNGVLRRSTSSIKYKTDVETLQDSYADEILKCRPVWYRSKSEYDNQQWGHWGFIAEEVAEIDPRLCFYGENEDGSLEPEGVQYDRFVPHLLNLIKRQQQAIEDLQAEVAALKAQ